MTANWWQSPGPAALVRRVAADIRTGRCIILLASSIWPSGFRGEVLERVREIFLPLDTISIPDGVGFDPATVLNDELLVLDGAIRPTPARLANANGRRGHLTWVRLSARGALEPWCQFLQEFAHASAGAPLFDRWLMVLEVRGMDWSPAAISEASLAVHEVRGACDSLDTALFVAQGIEDDRPLARMLRIQMIAGLALWDAELCELLLTRELAEIATPYVLLRDFGTSRNWTQGTVGWSTGADDEYDGVALRHSSILALSDDHNELDYRLWRAQVGIILPFVEERRRVLGERYAHLLRFPIITDDGEITDVRDLQVGLLAYHLLNSNRVDRDDRELLVLLRSVRNRLAHYEPLTPVQLTSLVLLPRVTR